MARRDTKNAGGVLLAALAGGATHQEAATQAGVFLRTVYRRLENAAFRRQLAGARGDLIKRAIGRLAAACSAAAATLAMLLRADSESVRLAAAKPILELAVRMRESEELEARISVLEDQHAAAATTKGARAWGA